MIVIVLKCLMLRDGYGILRTFTRLNVLVWF